MNRELPVNAEIIRGDEALKSAGILLSANMHLDAMSRVYYAVLHYARAVMLSINLEPKSHHGVFLLFNQQMVKTGKVDKQYSKIFGNLMRMREEADYITTCTFDAEDVSVAIAEAQQFREMAVKQSAAVYVRGYC